MNGNTSGPRGLQPEQKVSNGSSKSGSSGCEGWQLKKVEDKEAQVLCNQKMEEINANPVIICQIILNCITYTYNGCIAFFQISFG